MPSTVLTGSLQHLMQQRKNMNCTFLFSLLYTIDLHNKELVKAQKCQRVESPGLGLRTLWTNRISLIISCKLQIQPWTKNLKAVFCFTVAYP